MSAFVGVVALGTGVVSAFVAEVIVAEAVVKLKILMRHHALGGVNHLLGIARRRSNDWPLRVSRAGGGRRRSDWRLAPDCRLRLGAPCEGTGSQQNRQSPFRLDSHVTSPDICSAVYGMRQIRQRIPCGVCYRRFDRQNTNIPYLNYILLVRNNQRFLQNPPNRIKLPPVVSRSLDGCPFSVGND